MIVKHVFLSLAKLIPCLSRHNADGSVIDGLVVLLKRPHNNSIICMNANHYYNGAKELANSDILDL